MNNLINQQFGNVNNAQGQQAAPGQINITVKCPLQANNEVVVNQKVSDQIPFNTFAQFVIKAIFAQQIETAFEKTIEFAYGRQVIASEEVRTLKELGIQDNTEINVKLKLKGG